MRLWFGLQGLGLHVRGMLPVRVAKLMIFDNLYTFADEELYSAWSSRANTLNRIQVFVPRKFYSPVQT